MSITEKTKVLLDAIGKNTYLPNRIRQGPDALIHENNDSSLLLKAGAALP
jgi:hypothetical protein